MSTVYGNVYECTDTSHPYRLIALPGKYWFLSDTLITFIGMIDYNINVDRDIKHNLKSGYFKLVSRRVYIE